MLNHWSKACAAILTASFGLVTQAATVDFTTTYKGSGGNSTGCTAYTFDIVGKEPAGAGRHPVFIYTVGTSESINNGPARDAIQKMAAKGYVAAIVGYSSGLFGSCSYITNKARCAFNPLSTQSAIAKICSRAKADCSKGIVTAGFSQGAVMATLARNFDPRVRAAYGMGLHNKYATFSTTCATPSERKLPKDRLRVSNGEEDGYGGDTEASNRATSIAVTGYTCTGTQCLQPNGSGWVVVKNSDVTDGQADHCFMRASGDCIGSQTTSDANWLNGNNNWGLNAALGWLDSFVTH
jgi:dienelactone hydrolase